jgi:outer membrane receptor protein involved in Fe transport
VAYILSNATATYLSSKDNTFSFVIPAEQYVDLNLRSKNTLAKDLTISAYIKNLFNNQHSLPGGVNEGQVDPQNGRQFGIYFSYQF